MYYRMVKIFLCGPAGSGKTQLLEQLRKQVRQCRKMAAVTGVTQTALQEFGVTDREDVYDDQIFYNIQSKIIEKQISKEEGLRESDLISDNCLINAVVYSYHYLNQRSLEANIREKLVAYRNHMLILLSPIPNTERRRTQLRLSPKGWEEMKSKYIEIFNEYNIPFVDVGSLDSKIRIDMVTDALKGKIPYDLLTMDLEQTTSKHFPFFLTPVKFEQVCIPTIKIFNDHIEQDWTVEEKGKTNRFVHKYGHDRLALLAFDINIRASVVQKLLLNEVRIRGEIYNFLGCSSGGLKNRKCFMWRGPVDDVAAIIAENGEFAEIKTVSKWIARIGLLFSSVKVTGITISEEQVITEDDIEHNGKVFSDGCGGIGKELAKQIYTEIKETETAENYLPSVYQIRYQGYKGVLALDHTMPKTSIKVRPSMQKFKTSVHPNICVCDFAKPYTFGKLNKQYIQLLSGLKVPNSALEKKLDDYILLIQSMLYEKEAAIMILQWKNRFDLAQEILCSPSMDALRNTNLMKKVTEIQQTLVASIERLNILIPNSRNIYGVCDTSGALQYGQCFVRVTSSGVPKSIRGQVVVCKSPCYLLGDVRVLEAVDITDLNEGVEYSKDLVDCIVFPSKGVRPHPDEIAGSDLDGDMFFVCWDESLIPPATKPPYDYPAAEDKFRPTKVTKESVISYFSKQNETRKMVSRVDKYFNKWSDSKGIVCQECERLGCIFSRVIDASKTGESVNIPLALKAVTDDASESNVWVKMKNTALTFKQTFGEQVIQANQRVLRNHVSESFVKELLKQPVSNITEYDKFEFVFNYLNADEGESADAVDTFLHDYADFVNFTMFSLVEKRTAEELGIPHPILTNALNKSKILTNADLSHFQMQTSASPWKYYFRHGHDEFDWVHLIKALTEQDRTLIVVKIPNQITVVVQFMERQVLGMEQVVSPGSICALFYSKHFGYVRKYILGPSYLLDFTLDTLQLYRQTKPKTFIWLRAQDWPKNTKKKLVCEEIVNAVSVDLQRFDRRILEGSRKHPLITKTPLITLEVFAQNKMDTECYFDLVDVNDTQPVEDANEDDIDEGIISINFDELFPKAVYVKDIDSQEDLCELLKTAADSGNPYRFQSILEHWIHDTLPSDVSLHFIKLLESMTQLSSPVPLPGDIKDVIENLTSLTEQSVDSYLELTNVARILSQLHCDDIAHALVDKYSHRDHYVTGNELIDIVTCWENWWFLDSILAKLVLDNTYSMLIEYLLRSDALNQTEIRMTKYTCHFARLECLSLIQEMQSHKQQLVPKETETKPMFPKFDESEQHFPEDSENSISFLKVDRSEDTEQNLVTFYRMSAVSKRPNICKGHYVAMARHADFKAHPIYKSYCCLGQIREMRMAPFTMTVELVGAVPDVLQQCLLSDRTVFWRAEVIGNVTTFVRVMKALNQIASIKSSDHSACLMHITNPAGFINESALYQEGSLDLEANISAVTAEGVEGLNASQVKAVNTALRQNITLIQGPPGTGKTTVACSIIKKIVELKNYDKVLVVAETNIAVDNIARRLMNELLVLRVGADEGVGKDLFDITLSGQMQKISESVNVKRTTFQDEHGISHRNTQLTTKILNSADVVLTTCAGAGDPILESVKFEFVLVDEATQTTEPTLLCSLVHGSKHLVMIGDPKQLGPHVNETTQTSSVLPQVTELSTTVYHRFYETSVIPNICFLDTQHRMHKAIMRFPSQVFYDNKLVSGVPENRPRVIFPWPKKNMPLCFLDVTGPHEKRVGTSFCNLHEIKSIQQIVDCLLSVEEEKRDQRLSIDDIGILTTYKAQVNGLRQRIKQKVEISSVDGFQGREKEVIVVSTVRANNHGKLGFSDDRNRINVLLTRAKRGLIIVGNEHTLKSSEIWKEWLKHAPKLDYRSIDCKAGTDMPS